MHSHKTKIHGRAEPGVHEAGSVPHRVDHVHDNYEKHKAQAAMHRREANFHSGGNKEGGTGIFSTYGVEGELSVTRAKGSRFHPNNNLSDRKHSHTRGGEH